MTGSEVNGAQNKRITDTKLKALLDGEKRAIHKDKGVKKIIEIDQVKFYQD